MEKNESVNSSGNPTKSVTVRRIENPFAFKVGQVFTGFGVGCGIGIGVGRPINLGAIPVLNEVMVATRGATGAFSGVGRHANQFMRKFGVKNVEAGVGCGVGFGHGFGVGLAVKPGVVNQIQSFLMEAASKMITKFGISPNLSMGQSMLPPSLQSSITLMNDRTSNQSPVGNLMQLTTTLPDPTTQDEHTNSVSTLGTFASKTAPLTTSYGSRTEKVLNNFLQNPILKGEGSEVNNLAEQTRADNKMVQLVLKHQKVIDDLMEENKKLRRILVEDLKVPDTKVSTTSSSPCTECFECRRKQRRRR